MTQAAMQGNFKKNEAGRRTLPGMYMGQVEYALDPLAMGRCKVRVRGIHGASATTPTDRLPWARPVLQGYAGSDFGDFKPPLVGVRVWVSFENGQNDLPLYLGSWVSAAPESRKFGIVLDANGNPVPVTGTPLSIDDWDANAGVETPRESQVMTVVDPRRSVSKTPKGATQLTEDRDGSEEMTFIDRAGQVLQFIGRVNPADNVANATQRGTDSVLQGKGLEYSKLVGDVARVLLSDLAGQGVSLNAVQGGESVRIKSNPEAAIGNPDSAGERHVIDVGGGAGRTSIDLVKANKVVGRVVFDSNSGAFILECDEMITLRSELINLAAGQVNITGTLTAASIVATEAAIP